MTENPGGTPRRALLEHIPEMVTVSDREGKVVYANPATARVSGYAPEEFVALHSFEQMHPEDRPRCEEAFAELLGNPGMVLEIEHRVRHKDGPWRWVEGTFASLFDDPEVGGLLATVRDITGRKRTEEALRESEERYRAFVTASSDAVYRMSPDWFEMRQLNGRGFISDAAEPTEHWMERYIHPDDRTLIEGAIEEAVRTKSVFEL